MILYYKNKERRTTKIEVDYRNNSVKIENYSDFPLELAFGVNKHPTMEDFEEFLESRCFPRIFIPLSFVSDFIKRGLS